MIDRALYLLLILSFAASAEPGYQQVMRSHMGWRIPTYVPAVGRPITLCQNTLYDLKQGERVHLNGWSQIDAPSMSPALRKQCKPGRDCSGIGMNLVIAYCDDSEPACNFTGRDWPADSGVSWGAGNVSHDGEHHKTPFTEADYVSPLDQSAVTFRLYVNIYGPKGRVATIDDCRLTSSRHRD